MDMEQNRLLMEARLQLLSEEHRDLDEAVDLMIQSGKTDMLRLQRLKKRKLMLKDEITKIRSKLTPDILA